MAIQDGDQLLPYQREVDVATQAVRTAAKLSQRIISEKNKGVIQKDDLTPVTVADFAIQAFLSATIRAHFPEDTIVGEEDAAQMRGDLILLEHVYELLRWVAGYGDGEDAEAAKKAFPSDCRVPNSREHLCELIDECGSSKPSKTGRTWVFDPIDGTKTYVKGELYAINTALLVDGKQVVGVIGCPNLSKTPEAPLRDAGVQAKGSIAFAVKGHGAFVRSMEEDGVKPVSLAQQDQTLGLDGVRFVTSTTVNSTLPGFNEELAKRIRGNASEPEYPTVDLLPWVLRWVSLARGLANTTVWIYKSQDRMGKIWDHAGAMLLFEETGGVITDARGKPIDLTAGRKMEANFSFVAAPAKIHGQVLEMTQTLLQDLGHGGLLNGKE